MLVHDEGEERLTTLQNKSAISGRNLLVDAPLSSVYLANYNNIFIAVFTYSWHGMYMESTMAIIVNIFG